MARKPTPDVLTDLLGPGEPTDSGERHRLHVYLTKALARRTASLARRKGLSSSAIVTLALEAYLQENEPKL